MPCESLPPPTPKKKTIKKYIDIKRAYELISKV